MNQVRPGGPARSDGGRATPAPTVADLPPPPPGRTGWPWTVGSPPVPPTRPDGGAWPRISVVTPSFRQGHFIEETIRSVLLQGYPEVELVVVDGGSTDGTVEVLRRYEPWLAHWVSEPDRGQTHAINKGLARTTGEVFAYLNSDDVYEPGAFAAVGARMGADPGVDVVHGACVYMDEAGVELYRLTGRVTGFADYLRIWDRFVAGDYLTQPEVFCRREAVVAAGGFREELRSVMDFEMWLRLLARGCRFEAIDAPLARFRTYVAQKSSVDPGYELCRIVEEYIESDALESGLRPALRAELAVARAHFLVRGAIAATMMDEYGTALRYCWSAASRYPRIALSYSFWSTVGHPVRKRIPAPVRRALRGLAAQGGGRAR